MLQRIILIRQPGYGYDDIGRDNLDKVFADAFGAGDVNVHPFVPEHHPDFYCSPGCFGTAICSLPFTEGRRTLVDAIGVFDAEDDVAEAANTIEKCSLKERGVRYSQIAEFDAQTMTGVFGLKALLNVSNGNMQGCLRSAFTRICMAELSSAGNGPGFR